MMAMVLTLAMKAMAEAPCRRPDGMYEMQAGADAQTDQIDEVMNAKVSDAGLGEKEETAVPSVPVQEEPARVKHREADPGVYLVLDEM